MVFLFPLHSSVRYNAKTQTERKPRHLNCETVESHCSRNKMELETVELRLYTEDCCIPYKLCFIRHLVVILTALDAFGI